MSDIVARIFWSVLTSALIVILLVVAGQNAFYEFSELINENNQLRIELQDKNNEFDNLQRQLKNEGLDLDPNFVPQWQHKNRKHI